MSAPVLAGIGKLGKDLKDVPKYDAAIHAATGLFKPSIILFDTRAGTREFVVPRGVKRIRAFVVGAGGSNGGSGGGYSEKEYLVSGGDIFSYTVGEAPGGTSSFNSEITATGGGNAGGAAGVGSGGDINTSGGVSTGLGGSSSGHRYGDGLGAFSRGGAGWGSRDTFRGGTSGGIDGFGIGLIPTGHDGSYSTSGTTSNTMGAISYGSGSTTQSSAYIGGGGGDGGDGGIGGGGGGRGGPGLVGIEVLEVE